MGFITYRRRFGLGNKNSSFHTQAHAHSNSEAALRGDDRHNGGMWATAPSVGRSAGKHCLLRVGNCLPVIVFRTFFPDLR